MKIVTHKIVCTGDGCHASITLELVGAHDLRSAGQMHYDVAVLAGWDPGKHDEDTRCPVHRAPGVGCRCEASRRGIRHEDTCPYRNLCGFR